MKEDFRILCSMVNRNNKIYFRDKLTFFLSLITPLILVALFLTFMRSVYTDVLLEMIPEGIDVSDRIINGFTGGWLFSSILGVSCVTISFCSNMIIATDKMNKNILDFNITPVKQYLINISYFISNFIVTFIVCFVCMLVSFVYLAIVGWYISVIDILMIILTVVIYTLFGSMFSTIICSFITSQGGVSAVSTLVSSMYGFLCGAYMPISQFSQGIRYFVSFIPGTYGTVLFRQFYMRGTMAELASKGVPNEVINIAKDEFDSNFYFCDNKVQTDQMFLVLIVTSILLFGVYMLMMYRKSKTNKKQERK